MARQLHRFKIDIHHHIFLPQLAQQKKNANERIGFITPPGNLPWSVDKSLDAMRELGVAAAVLSYPAGIAENLLHSPFCAREVQQTSYENAAEEDRRRMNRAVVREMNCYAKKLCDEDEKRNCGAGRFAWFAALPDLRDTEGELAALTF